MTLLAKIESYDDFVAMNVGKRGKNWLVSLTFKNIGAGALADTIATATRLALSKCHK